MAIGASKSSMKRVYIEETWPESWKSCYPYDLIEVYNETAGRKGYAYAYENRQNHVFQLVKSVAKPPARILDMAAAQGNYSLTLAEAGYDIVWNDIRGDLAEYVEMKREKGRITYKPGNAFEVDFEGLFEVVIALEIIEHVAHPDEFLANLAKLVKPGGYVVISTPLGTYFKNKLPKFTEYAHPENFEAVQFGPNSSDHIFLLHPEEMHMLAQSAGLQVMSMAYYNNFLTHGHVKLNKLLEVLPKNVVFGFEKFTNRLPRRMRLKVHTNFATLLRKPEE